ncbi:tetraspanin-11-like [Mangifera indica]|uniref:tetraspanin-11-like n=1 Tax=Mangifera indica TaxID=29780 RepID=UPI001CFBF0A5|nr:tetraspanin-11-like [Mangifera indica]
MACLISFVFIALNCLSLLSGFIAISCAAYVQFNGGTICQKALEAPLLVTGLILLLVSLLGLIGSCCRANGLLVFTIFILAVTNKAVGKRISVNPLQDYSQWLQNHAHGRKWQQIKGCLIDAKVCSDLNDVNIKDWSLIQSGCCKPPMYCGLKLKNSTIWVVPEGGPAVADSDCTTFSNHRQTLCYDCKSCKGGVLDEVRQEWRLLGAFIACMMAILMMMFSLGCCIWTKYKDDDKPRGHRHVALFLRAWPFTMRESPAESVAHNGHHSTRRFIAGAESALAAGLTLCCLFT